MGNVNVHVYKNSDGEFRVYPPVVVVSLGNGDTVTLVNHTPEDLSWLAPKGLFTTTVPDHDPISNGGGKSKAKAVKKEGAYNHLVMMESGKKAKGNSDPVIIVEA